MQSLSQLLKKTKSVKIVSHNLSKDIAKRKVNGEWLCDPYPNISLITSRSDKLVDSLVRRIQVKDSPMADGLVNELRQNLDLYESATKKYRRLNDEYEQYDQKSGNPLEVYDLKVKGTEAKYERETAYSNLMKLYGDFPNVITDALPSKSQVSLPNLQDVHIPSLTFNDALPAHSCRTYLTGEKALRELELTDFAEEYLQQCKFVPVTLPSFLRCEVTEQSGVKTGVESDIYTLLTKPEMHAASDSAQVLEERKPKVEDNFVYQARGLCELSLMAFFIRRDLQNNLPVKLYSIGNQYRMMYGGEPPQSRVALFITASKDEENAAYEFSSGVTLMENFWNVLNVDVTKLTVEPHHLAQHEACATEFVMNCRTDNKNRVVLSRMSLSHDYVSRRIMTYSSFNRPQHDRRFCHFTTGTLIDINLLLENL